MSAILAGARRTNVWTHSRFTGEDRRLYGPCCETFTNQTGIIQLVIWWLL